MHIHIICVNTGEENPDDHLELGYMISDALQVALKEMKSQNIQVNVSFGDKANEEADIAIWFVCEASDIPLTVNNNQQNYKLFLNNLEEEHQPEAIKNLRSYHLSRFDNRIGKEVTLSIPLLEGYRVFYWLVISDLALDIYDAFNQHHYSKQVFLGDTSDDLRMERLLLKRDLKAFGFDILPKKDYPCHTDSMSQIQWEDLNDVEIAIHLAGGREGEKINHDAYSFLEWQEKVTETYVLQNENKIKKFVWVPPTVRFSTDKRKFYIEKLLKNVDEHEATYTFKTDLEKFKTILHGELSTYSRGEDPSLKDDFAAKKVYLMCDIEDTEHSEILESRLSTLGFGILKLGTGQGAKMMRRQHQRHLQVCNSTIIFVDKAPDDWILAKLQDNLRASGLGRKEPLNTKAIVATNYGIASRLSKILDGNPLYKSVGIFVFDDVMISDDLLSFLSSF
ncbi:hypothetical protein [Flammeovirga aprica]|uniref:TIR domain-containing protein n=1 Tax=Flammeovirga aprica JL-4 TaxID=694437 RepID=A0A7X9RTG6_9BACT|nr:hypothetical protein [Flammeovirga aprica]NME68475.1 hypothetical protein [Flammeovirga aprica JL-4]